jgi:hypothetical protein
MRFDTGHIGATEVSWITPDEVASMMRQLIR